MEDQVCFNMKALDKILKNKAIISWEYLYKALNISKLYFESASINIDCIYMNISNQKIISEKLLQNCLVSTLSVVKEYNEVDRIKYHGWDTVRFAPTYCIESYDQGLYIDKKNDLKGNFNVTFNNFLDIMLNE